MKYSTSLSRFLAALIDVVIVGVVTSVLVSLAGRGAGSTVQSFFNLLGFIYYVGMTYYYGATLGKKALNMKVVDEATGNKLTFGQVIMREVVGKLISGVVLLLGFVWIIFDAKKQGWHDKIAKTVVVNA